MFSKKKPYITDPVEELHQSQNIPQTAPVPHPVPQPQAAPQAAQAAPPAPKAPAAPAAQPAPVAAPVAPTEPYVDSKAEKEMVEGDRRLREAFRKANEEMSSVAVDLDSIQETFGKLKNRAELSISKIDESILAASLEFESFTSMAEANRARQVNVLTKAQAALDASTPEPEHKEDDYVVLEEEEEVKPKKPKGRKASDS